MPGINFSIAQAVENTEAPPIPRAQAWGATYVQNSKSDSPPLLDLSQGVPKSAPHQTVLESLSVISSHPASARYGPIIGEPSLRAAIATEIRSQYRLPSTISRSEDGQGRGGGMEAADIAITTGCNMAFLTLMMTLCPPSKSSVLIPLPTYFNMSMTLSLQSIKPIYIPTDPSSEFKPSLENARTYLVESSKSSSEIKPRAIVLISPNNPTGTVLSGKVLKEWYDLAREFEVALVIDETYRDFVELSPEDGVGSDGEERGKPHDLFREEDWRGTLVALGSFSKSYRIPGHRLGYMVASPYLLQRIATVCDCMQICPPRPPQIALAPLLPSLRADITKSSIELSSRRQLFRETIAKVEGWECISTGGFFAYVSFPENYVGKLSSGVGGDGANSDDGAGGGGSERVAKVLAEECGVVTLPGSFFMPSLDGPIWTEIGAEGAILKTDRWLRFAVANVDDDIIVQLGPRLEKMNALMGV